MPIDIKAKNKLELKQRVKEIWDSIDMRTINSLVESFYYRLILVATHDGESIQAYYRHYRERITEYEEKAREFLQSRTENFPLLQLNELIRNQDINYPSPLQFSAIQQIEEQNLDEPEHPTSRQKWTIDEDIILFTYMNQIGPKYAWIARQMPERSVDSIKSRITTKEYNNHMFFLSSRTQ